MTKSKIMTRDSLENITGRLIRCRAVLDAICEAMDGDLLEDALTGVSDLLGSICRDFQADIDAAWDYTEGTPEKQLGRARWQTLAENCKACLPPMYRAFLDLCSGTLEGNLLTVYASDDLMLRRMDNQRVREALTREAEGLIGKPVQLDFEVADA